VTFAAYVSLIESYAGQPADLHCDGLVAFGADDETDVGSAYLAETSEVMLFAGVGYERKAVDPSRPVQELGSSGAGTWALHFDAVSFRVTLTLRFPLGGCTARDLDGAIGEFRETVAHLQSVFGEPVDSGEPGSGMSAWKDSVPALHSYI